MASRSRVSPSSPKIDSKADKGASQRFRPACRWLQRTIRPQKAQSLYHRCARLWARLDSSDHTRHRAESSVNSRRLESLHALQAQKHLRVAVVLQVRERSQESSLVWTKIAFGQFAGGCSSFFSGRHRLSARWAQLQLDHIAHFILLS